MAQAWSFDPIWANLPLLANGVKVTLLLALMTMAMSLVIGAVLACLMEYAPLPLRLLAIGYTEFFRALPLLVLLFWIYLVLPIYPGWTLPAFEAGLIGLTITVSAFVAEAFRTGVTSVGPGQRQAGEALGMRQLDVIRRVIWPQAWRRTIPIVGAIWVGLFKDSALVSLIQVHDLMFAGRVIANKSFRFLEVYTAVALIYFALAYPQGWLVDRLFARFRVEE